MKKSAKVLLYFSVDCGMLEGTIDASPAFWSTVQRKKIAG
jgi:hypothetical protein